MILPPAIAALKTKKKKVITEKAKKILLERSHEYAYVHLFPLMSVKPEKNTTKEQY